LRKTRFLRPSRSGILSPRTSPQATVEHHSPTSGATPCVPLLAKLQKKVNLKAYNFTPKISPSVRRHPAPGADVFPKKVNLKAYYFAAEKFAV
jgi:hypothetical protein